MCKIAGLKLESRQWHLAGLVIFLYILHHHGRTGEKQSLISLKNVLNETIFTFIKSQLMNTHLFLCDKVGCKLKYFCLILRQLWLFQGKTLVKLFELTTVFMEHHLSLKEQLASYGYLNLSIWQTLSQMNRTVVFVANDKFMLLNEN